MSTDWDIESYKSEFETEEHWELKKTFILAHKDRFPEDEIVCLAQVFANIELLGCRYPEETMRKVAELAKGVVESYREKKKNSLKRTFVAASDAALAKTKGNQKKSKYIEEMKSDFLLQKETNFLPKGKSQCMSNTGNEFSLSRNLQSRNQDSSGSEHHTAEYRNLSGPFAHFVLFLYDEHPVSLLERNASLNKSNLSWKYDRHDSVICSVYINGNCIGRGEGGSHKVSKESAGREAIKSLQRLCYTVKVKAQFISDSALSPEALCCSDAEQTKIKSDVGEQLMKKMGWVGGGLGANQQGIIEPINLLPKFGLGGFGLNTAKMEDREFRDRARSAIRNWLQSETDQDLVFSADFTVEQRKILHQLGTTFSLKSKSYGKGDKRHLVLSKNPPPWKLVEELLKVGGKTEKYELIVPET